MPRPPPDPDTDLTTEMRDACSSGDLEKVRILFNEVKYHEDRDRTVMAMALAAINGQQIQVLEFCLEQGVEADWMTGSRAASKGSLPVYKLLLAAGLDVNENFDYFGDALCIAIVCQNTELVTYLLDNGAELDSGRLKRYMMTPLACAALEGPPELVSLLISRAAPPFRTP